MRKIYCRKCKNHSENINPKVTCTFMEQLCFHLFVQYVKRRNINLLQNKKLKN